MKEVFNLYCDESCHLENDGQKAMVLGAVWSPESKRREIDTRLREIKTKHRVKPGFEAKWTKVSSSKIDLYMDLIDYFFDDDDLYFRALVIPDKSILNHKGFEQSHDDWHYKMYFTMLKTIFHPASQYRVYIDIKDTWGHKKVENLHEVLCNSSYDFSKNIIARVQQIRSHESEQIQITDLLIGALSYLHRELDSSTAKTLLLERIKKRSGYKLTSNTLLRELKFNLLIWEPK